MFARFIVIAATFVSGGALAAETPKATPQPVAQPQPSPAPVALASADDADQMRSPDPASHKMPVTPKLHRIARVTTCRCGEVAPQSDDDQQ